MKTLLILRHAKSSWKHVDLPDHERPLNKRGKQDAPRMGQLLVEQDLVPDFIITSAAKRARKTAKKVAKACGYAGQIEETWDFYHAPAEDYITVLSRLPEDHQRVMLVGHNPDLEDFLEMLTGQPEVMPTATLAQVALPIQQWGDLSPKTKGTLVNIWRPKELLN